MSPKVTRAPDWVANAIEALPDDLEDDQIAAFMFTVITMYRDDPREVLPLILSLALTYSRTVGLPLDILQRSYKTAAEGVGLILTKESGMMN